MLIVKSMFNLAALYAISNNVLPWIALFAAVFAIVNAGRQPLWAEAYRRLSHNRLAIAAITIIGIYCAIAMLDSMQWRNSKTDEPKTVLDRMFAHVPQEYTYSSPFAKLTTGEPHPHKVKGTHVLGTDGNGKDILYQTLKGCRTAIIIGGVTTLLVTPVALFFGMMAGFYGKRVDDLVQFGYTVLASVPDILLLISIILILGRGTDKLCIALSITGWVGLCRLVRGETLKHRDREYVRGARALGMTNARVMVRHILPNLLPVVIITVTLNLSGLVLSETILSYLGIGVEAGTGSWGNMIDAARLELSRDPVIWWNLVAASSALFLLVLSFNILGDALRDALDPRLRSS